MNGDSRKKSNLDAKWKYLAPEVDSMAQQSVSQELLEYIPPAVGTVQTKFNLKSAEFSAYVDRAIKLKVNLKAVGHC